MNTEPLLEVKRQILENPEQLNMSDWFCGSAMCIGGHLVYNAGWQQISAKSQDCYHEIFGERRISTVAAEILGIDMASATRLFHIVNWPMDFMLGYERAERTDDSKRIAEVTARRIDDFIFEMTSRKVKEEISEACAVA